MVEKKNTIREPHGPFNKERKEMLEYTMILLYHSINPPPPIYICSVCVKVLFAFYLSADEEYKTVNENLH